MLLAEDIKSLSAHCQSYRGADTRRSIIQLSSTFLMFACAIAAMFAAFHHGIYWLYAALMLPAAGLLVRLFIIQHDCGHASFFSSRRINDAAGRILSVFTFIPYGLWRRSHNLHHGSSGNLNQRGAGGVETLTVREYQALSKGRRFLYRLYRHPVMLLFLGPPIYILFMLRFPPTQAVPFLDDYHPLPSKEAWSSAMALNLALLVIYGSLVALLGWKTGLLVYLPLLVLSFWIGQWLFFIQHQFENAYWQPQEKWSYQEAAIYGSSYYSLPPLLQWFTGNIGFHHIHHMCPAIPNYRLQECFRSSDALKAGRRMTFRGSLKSIGLALWDEDRQRMVRFADL